jgi:hypothetical protein
MGEAMAVLMMLIVLAFWVVTPLIPAILLFKLLPDNAIQINGPMAGPLGNFRVNASGAIAAYLAVLIALAFFIVSIYREITHRPPPGPTRQHWKVVGQLELRDAEGNPLPFRNVGRDRIKLVIDPGIWRVDDVAEFEIKMILVEEEPVIRVNIDKFGMGLIKIKKDSPHLEFKDDNTIRIKSPLRVDQDTSYARVERQMDTAN